LAGGFISSMLPNSIQQHGRIGQRMSQDIQGIGQGVIDTVSHPIDALTGLGTLARGAVQTALPKKLTDKLVAAGVTPEARPQFNSVTNQLAQSYGSPQKIMQTAYDRPVSTALNILGGVQAIKGLSRLANTAGQASQTVQALSPVEQSLMREGARVTGQEVGRRSASSAGTRFSQQAQANGINPEITNIMSQAEDAGVIHPTAAANHIATQSLPIPVNLTEGQALENIHKLSQEQNLRGVVPQYADRFAEQNTALKDNLSAIHDIAAPDISTTSHLDDADAIIGAYKSIDDRFNTDIRTKYKALEDANGGQLPMEARTFVANAKSSLARVGKTAFLPSPIKKILGEFGNTGNMTFEQFESLRTTLASEARKYEGGLKADGNKAFAVNVVRKSLEETPVAPGTATDLKQLADTARAAARERFSLIEKDKAYQAAIWDKVPADRYIDKFVLNGTKKGLETLLSNVGNDDLIRQTIANSTLRELTKRARIVDGNGNFASASYANRLDSLSPKLDLLVSPQIKNYLDNLKEAARLVNQRPTGSRVNSSNTAVSLFENSGMIPGLKNISEHFKQQILLKDAERALSPGAGIVKRSMENNQ